MQKQPIILEENQVAEPLDEAIHAALDEAEAAFARGEGVPLEKSREIIRKQYQAWLKTQQEVRAA